MDHIVIHVHENESQLYILGRRGELSEQPTRTITEHFAAALGDRPYATS
jgi:hypothetical protein